MPQRPKIKIELTRFDSTFEIIGWILVCAVWGFTLANFKSLPDIIPTHYNFTGVADRFGKKWMILTLPLVATSLFVTLTILNKFPHILNYPTEITEENALTQYTNATRLIRCLKVVIVIILGLGSYQTIKHANAQTQVLGTWFLPLTIALIFIPLIWFIIKSLKAP